MVEQLKGVERISLITHLTALADSRIYFIVSEKIALEV
jgi:hypothetical protein